jgi:dCTP diphosphatase
MYRIRLLFTICLCWGIIRKDRQHAARGAGMDEKTTVRQLLRRALVFRDERNWKQFHDPKNLAAALSIEAGELQELFLWKSKEEVQQFIGSKEGRKRLGEEIADVFIYLLFLADSAGMDLSLAFDRKLTENCRKYPVDKSRGSSRKYNILR